MCKCAIHTTHSSRTEPSCSWVISRGYLTLPSKTDRIKAEKRFPSSSKAYRSLSFFFANCLLEILLNSEHTCSTIQAIQPKIIIKKRQKLQVTNCNSHQLTNTALGLFLFSTETGLSRFVTCNQSTPFQKWASRHRDLQQEVFRCTVFISYRVHNKLLSTCNIPTKSYIQCKKIQYFLLIFCFKFFLYIF